MVHKINDFFILITYLVNNAWFRKEKLDIDHAWELNTERITDLFTSAQFTSNRDYGMQNVSHSHIRLKAYKGNLAKQVKPISSSGYWLITNILSVISFPLSVIYLCTCFAS